MSKNPFLLARASLLGAVALISHTASAAIVITEYHSGDIFLGFRQPGETQTLVVNLGSAAQFLPPTLGGTWNGSPLHVKFGIKPGTSTLVDNLAADLIGVFGSDWAADSVDGTSLRWGIAGFTDNLVNDVPINGYNARTAFVTKPRTDPNTQSATLGSVNLDGFGVAFNAFVVGLGGGSYVNQQSTENSSVAFVGDGSQANNWNTRIGAAGNFSLGSNRTLEQLSSGLFQGPTDSVLDLYIAPSAESDITLNRTYAGGSFTLNSSGELIYGAIPEPGSVFLLGFGATLLSIVRRRSRAESH